MKNVAKRIEMTVKCPKCGKNITTIKIFMFNTIASCKNCDQDITLETPRWVLRAKL